MRQPRVLWNWTAGELSFLIVVFLSCLLLGWVIWSSVELHYRRSFNYIKPLPGSSSALDSRGETDAGVPHRAVCSDCFQTIGRVRQ